MAKKKVTRADLDKTLREFGFKEGDEIFLPSTKNQQNESTTQSGGEGDDEDEEDTNHPSKKGGN